MITRSFLDVLGIKQFPLQRTIFKTFAGEPLTDEESVLFKRHAGRDPLPPGDKPHEVHVITGRQSGKTGFLAAPYALYRAFDPATVQGLQPGYMRDIVVVSPTLRQSRVMYQRIRGLIESTSQLRQALKGEPTKHEIEFKFGVRIGVWPAVSAHLRGMQIALLLMDEGCHTAAEGPRADYLVFEAAGPGMAMVPGAQTGTISSPWIEQGYVFEAFRRRASRDGVIVFQAASWELNPDIPQDFLDRERQRDPDFFRREYGGEFVSGIDAFLPAEAVEACTVSGRQFLAPESGTRYAAAVDQAYKQDTFVLGIAHREDDTVVVDHLRGWEPGRGRTNRLDQLLPELESEIAAYGIRIVLGDQFASEPFHELLSTRGLAYHERTFTSDSKRDMYASLKDAILSQRIELLDHGRSLRELRTLEARATSAGHVRIEAPRGAGFSDDFADTLAILAHELRPSRTANVLAVGDRPDAEWEERARRSFLNMEL